MKIGIFGGTFNPIHSGHLNAAKEVLRLAGIEEVWFLPTFKNPLKESNSASPAQRLEMIMLAIEGGKDLALSDFDIKNKITRTIDSIRGLKKKFPQHEFYFIMGSNLVQEFCKWKQPGEIVEEAPIIIVPLPELSEIREPLLKNAIVLREAARVNVTSTIVRGKIRNGEHIDGMVPDAVARYIKKNKLYK